MITVRKAKDRGHNNIGWLNTYHTFSFDTYYDRRFMNFRSLRVINEDFVKQGEGFGMHPHNDMEIITIVLEGELEHKDSMGNGSVIRPGDVQKMSAGSGILHSEFNHSKENPVHLYQIWIRPESKGLEPNYEQKKFERNQKLNKLLLIASKNDSDDVIKIYQDAHLYNSIIEQGKEISYELDSSRFAWIQVISGKIELNGVKLEQSDGAAVEEEGLLRIKADEDSEFLLFDLN